MHINVYKKNALEFINLPTKNLEIKIKNLLLTLKGGTEVHSQILSIQLRGSARNLIKEKLKRTKGKRKFIELQKFGSVYTARTEVLSSIDEHKNDIIGLTMKMINKNYIHRFSLNPLTIYPLLESQKKC